MDVNARYHPVPDQIELASTFGDALRDLLPIARLHSAPADNGAIFDQLTGIGLFSIARSQADGGSGLSIVEECLIANSLGRQLVSPSIVATLGAQTPFGLAEGTQLAAAYIEDDRVIVVDGEEAEWLLLREENGARLIATAGLTLMPVEAGLWLSHLHAVERAAAQSSDRQGDSQTLLRLRLIDAAVLAGIASCAQEMATAYAQLREQFGRPIGSFQAVKHSCADMAIAARCASDQVNFAAVALDAGRTDAALQVESALLVAIDAAIGNAGRNIQIHGGIGFSNEAEPHLVLKRARTFATIAGGTEKALDRIASLPFNR